MIFVLGQLLHGSKSGTYQSKGTPRSTDSCIRRVVKNCCLVEIKTSPYTQVYTVYMSGVIISLWGSDSPLFVRDNMSCPEGTG